MTWLDALRWLATFAGVAVVLFTLLHLRDKYLCRGTDCYATHHQTASLIAHAIAGAYVAVEQGFRLGDERLTWRLWFLLLYVAVALWSLLTRQPWERR